MKHIPEFSDGETQAEKLCRLAAYSTGKPYLPPDHPDMQDLPKRVSFWQFWKLVWRK